jgi:lysozyme
MTDYAQRLIEEEEGIRLIAYKDSLDLWTIGYGHLLEPQDKDWTGYNVSPDQAQSWLDQDMGTARSLATQFPHYVECNDVRQAVLISMCYQLGSKPLHWPHFMAALEAKDYTAAKAAGLDSLWAKQTPRRAQRQMDMLESGVWA